MVGPVTKHTATAQLWDFEVVSNEPCAQGLFRLCMQVPAELCCELTAGMFVNVAVPGDASQLLRLPLSFASCDQTTIELVYAVVGDGTRRLSAMRPGDHSTVVAPLGNGWWVPAQAGKLLLIAGGVGLPPVMAAANMLAEQGKQLDVIVGAQTARRVWQEGCARLASLGAYVTLTTDDGSAGIKGFTTSVAQELLASYSYAGILACGPYPMLKGVAQLAQEHHTFCEVSLERMMTCGFGACNTCNVAMRAGGYKSCCTDGPVFDASEVAWDV